MNDTAKIVYTLSNMLLVSILLNLLLLLFLLAVYRLLEFVGLDNLI